MRKKQLRAENRDLRATIEWLRNSHAAEVDELRARVRDLLAQSCTEWAHRGDFDRDDPYAEAFDGYDDETVARNALARRQLSTSFGYHLVRRQVRYGPWTVVPTAEEGT